MSSYLQEFGSIDQLITRLFSSKLHGLKSSDVSEARRVFGRNKIEPPPPTSFIRLVFESFKELTIIILFVSAILSLILTTTVKDPKDMEWVDSVAILAAVFIVVIVTACNDYSKERQFRKLNAIKDDKLIEVIRDGQHNKVSIFDVVVGDIVVLETGDQIPADGLVICSTDLKIDESSMTGESDEIKKSVEKPFLTGSCLVTGGTGRMIVTCVGRYSVYGDILATLQEDEEMTPL